MARRSTELAELMLALRLVEDEAPAGTREIGWIHVWSAYRSYLMERLHGDTESPEGAYFEQLRPYLSNDSVSRFAVLMADAFDSACAQNRSQRVETIVRGERLLVRFVGRTYPSDRDKPRLAEAHGQVSSDLNPQGSASDLTVLLASFVKRSEENGIFRAKHLLCVMPHQRPEVQGELPNLIPLVAKDLLSAEEYSQLFTGRAMHFRV